MHYQDVMQNIDRERAAATRLVIAPFVTKTGGVKMLAQASGLSEQTIRTVAATGLVSTFRTAKAIEAGTRGAVSATDIIQPGARGGDIYDSFPGNDILQICIERRRSPGELLASVGISHQDLHAYAHGRERAPEAVKRRVDAALGLLSISNKAGEE